jgi:hypothetical protein
MTNRRAEVLVIRLDTGARFTLSLRGVVEITRDEIEQSENVRLQFNGSSYSFTTVTAMFRSLAAHETSRPTRS